MRKLAVGLLAVSMLAASEARSQDSGGGMPGWLSGSARAAWWSGTRKLDNERGLPGAALWLKAEPKTADLAAVVDGWVRDEDLTTSGGATSHLREAYVTASRGAFDLRAGKQIIVWGRADQINPTDNLTPRDFTLLVPEPADDRLGTLAFQAIRRAGDYSLSATWLPDFKPNVVPLPPGVRAEIPSSARQLALKIDRSSAGGVDWSASYFSGFDLGPTLEPDPRGGGLLERHPRIQVLGADFALPVGRYGLRGEAAYTWTEDRDGVDPLKKKPFFFGVFGVERTFLDYLNVNVQYYTYVVRNYHDPREADPQVRALAVRQAILNHELERSERGMALRVSNKWWNETLEAEIAILASFERRDYAVKPKLTYAFNDRLKGTIGADVLRGSDQALFGLLRKNSVAYAELGYYF